MPYVKAGHFLVYGVIWALTSLTKSRFISIISFRNSVYFTQYYVTYSGLAQW